MAAHDLEYGFRYDPMTWIRESGSVPAAQVRTFLLETPQPDDSAILQQEIDDLLSGQAENGCLGEEQTAGKVIRLSRLGCAPEREDVQRAVGCVCREEEVIEDGVLGCYGLHVATWGRWQDTEHIERSVKHLADRVMTMNFWSMCPWGGQVHTHGLWVAREYGDVTAALERGLRIMLDDIKEGLGWPGYLDPFGFLDAAGNIDHPLAEQMVLKQLPFIFRTQLPDGSWGGMKHFGYGPEDATYIVLRALVKWGLLEKLRQLPPLPEDWRIVRSIPAPDGDLAMLTWCAGRLWVYDRGAQEVVALNPEDGTEVVRVGIPWKACTMGCIDDEIALVRVERNEKGRDIETLWMLGPDANEPLRQRPMKEWRSADGPWYVRGFYESASKVLFKRGSPPEGGDAPFGLDTTGVTLAGDDLWVLDNRGKRICMIEKSSGLQSPNS